MKQEIEEMLRLQDAMNSKVHPEWVDQNFEWYRAIWTECAEMLDHYGWKWWKKQSPDREQVVLELIDIWHFGLSILVLNNQNASDIASSLDQGFETKGVERATDFRDLLESFTLDVLQTKSFNAQLFASLMNAIGLDFQELYLSYVGKNVLNFFRQDHGYKDGSYHKVWNGREDNEHLVDVIAEHTRALTALSTADSGANIQDSIYHALAARYPK